MLGDAPLATWALQRPVAGITAGLVTLLVGRALVFFARVEAGAASRSDTSICVDSLDGNVISASATAADGPREPDECGMALA